MIENTRTRTQQSRPRTPIVYLCFVAAFVLHNSTTRCFAQTSPPPISVDGTITVTGDIYDYSTTDSTRQGHRPPSLYRILFAPTLHISDVVALPLNIILTSRETNTITPSVSNPTIAQFLENPANALGAVSFNPSIGWFGAHLGSHTPEFSELTAGDLQIFGAGVDLKPGSFQIAASAGVSQRAIEPDSSRGITGSYRRDMYLARVAFGQASETQLGINMAYAHDAPGSIAHNTVRITIDSIPGSTGGVVRDTERLRAEEGLVASMSVLSHFSQAVALSAEAAISNFTRDQTSPTDQIQGNPFASFMTTRTSTRVDYAGKMGLDFHGGSWGVKLNTLYLGPGFVPLGYPFMQSDRLEFTLAPRFQLFDRNLSLNGSIGERVNNLSGTKGETQTQVIGSGNLNATFSDAFSLSAAYSNYGVRNNQSNDTLRLQTVSQNISIDPTLIITGERITHAISAEFSIDEYADYNTISGASANNDTRMLSASYTVSFSKNPLSVGMNGSYVENRLSTGTLVIRSIGGVVGYGFFGRALMVSASVTASGSTMASSPTDDQIFYRVSARWKITNALSASASAGNNSYRYGMPLPNGSTFSERTFQFAITTRF